MWLSHHGRALFSLPNPAKPPSLALLNFYKTMLLIVSQGVFRVGVLRLACVMMMMMMLRMHLESIAIVGTFLLVPAVPYLVPLVPLLLGLWVHSCFKWFLTISISYK